MDRGIILRHTSQVLAVNIDMLFFKSQTAITTSRAAPPKIGGELIQNTNSRPTVNTAPCI
jgi:uncharacterized membrane protein (UPF0127 family)